MGRKFRIEQSPLAIKDVLVSNSGNNIKYNNLTKKEKMWNITYPVPYIKEHLSKETKYKYKTILFNMLLKHIPLCCFLTHVIYAGNYHMSCFENREHIMFCLETLDLFDEP